MSFENITLFLKEFEYCITLHGLLNEQFQVKNLHGEICFLIKTNDIFKFFRKFNKCVMDEIGVVCESSIPCRAHAAHQYIKY